MEWISVNDRLPASSDGVVMVALDDYGFEFRHGRVDTDRYEVNRWVRWFDHVTHWMPLPEPPKEDE